MDLSKQGQINNDLITDSNSHSELGRDAKSSQIGNENFEANIDNLTFTLENLQTNEQREILDTVSSLRQCGLAGDLLLPQLVVCGDQSSGKSSTLEALTEIPFPRNDNLCTRYATEIHLRRASADSLSVRVIPDNDRSEKSKASIMDFKCTITNFDELPKIMDKAMAVMGIDNRDAEVSHAFAKDVLCIEIEGPTRPQLTLVDIPGLIHTETRGITNVDVQLVSDITDKYISQPRTICLAVIAATSDYATQKILKKVREYDPEGERTLGIITKPDRIEGHGSFQGFLELAQNRDIQFRLGWHVLKNRSANEAGFTFEQRKQSEKKWLSESIFRALDSNFRGIDALRQRLSLLLYEHAKRELPKLREELENKLESTQSELAVLGTRRNSISECKDYLMRLCMSYQQICKAGIDGHYENSYFRPKENQSNFSIQRGDLPPSRIRAVVQTKNEAFAKSFDKNGPKYCFNVDRKDTGSHTPPTLALELNGAGEEDEYSEDSEASEEHDVDEINSCGPVQMGRLESLRWVGRFIERSRGKELIGNFNPLVIGELFWEQSSKWENLASGHLRRISMACSEFLRNLLDHKCPVDLRDRVWECLFADRLQQRKHAAYEELRRIITDNSGYPISYNHHYVENVGKRRIKRRESVLSEYIKVNSKGVPVNWKIPDLAAALEPCNADLIEMESEEALDCLVSIYKVIHKVFVANVVTQVVERHIVQGLEDIFSPLVVSKLSDEQIKEIAREPLSTRQERHRLEAKIQQLKAGQDAFKKVMGISVQ